MCKRYMQCFEAGLIVASNLLLQHKHVFLSFGTRSCFVTRLARLARAPTLSVAVDCNVEPCGGDIQEQE
jgi:hypothetical protein